MSYGKDWDREYAKHFVRYYGWFQAAKSYKKRLGDKEIKYFTLCAVQALDIFTFEHGGILVRDRQRKLPNVIICEKNKRFARKIYDVVRPPVKEAIIWNDIEKVLLFTEEKFDEKKAEILDMGEIPERVYEFRALKRAKNQFERLQNIFPFDIVNFDPCGSMLKNRYDGNDLFESFAKFFKYQRKTPSFLFFLTTEFYNIHKDNRPLFETAFNANVSAHQEIRDALYSAYRTTTYIGITEELKKSYLGFLKAAILPAAREYDWRATHRGVYVYENSSRNLMMSSIIEFNRATGDDNGEESVNDIVKVIQKMPSFISWDKGENDKVARAHLKEIIEYREMVRGEFRSS